MAYHIKAKYYAGKDCFEETLVLQSDNGGKDLKLDVDSEKVVVVPVGDWNNLKNYFAKRVGSGDADLILQNMNRLDGSD